MGRNMSLKNPVTPPGIDPGTARLVAQRLNHYTTPGPQSRFIRLPITWTQHVMWLLFFKKLLVSDCVSLSEVSETVHTVQLTHSYIQDVPGERVSILGGYSIDHSKQNTLYEYVSYSERFPR
jgi:hypothetical protein